MPVVNLVVSHRVSQGLPKLWVGVVPGVVPALLVDDAVRGQTVPPAVGVVLFEHAAVGTEESRGMCGFLHTSYPERDDRVWIPYVDVEVGMFRVPNDLHCRADFGSSAGEAPQFLAETSEEFWDLGVRNLSTGEEPEGSDFYCAKLAL